MPAVLTLLILAIFLCMPDFGEAAGTDPHSAAKQPEYCLKCHTADEAGSFRGGTGNACSKFCLSCHQMLDRHHPVNKRMTGKKNGSFVLAKGRTACITCHRINKNRYDSEPWASQSMYDRLFKSSTEYKTYYLIMKNDDGQLCKSCH